MAFWKRKKRATSVAPVTADTGKAQPAKKTIRRSPPAPLEIKLLALEALDADLTPTDVAQIIGVSDATIHGWRKQYRDGGVEALYRRPSSSTVRKACAQLEERILAHRREHPEHGVRRIRDELRREEGLSVSAEKVRTTVNAAGLGHPPPGPGRRSPQVRRFERPLPNALWQIDIFTFQLKRMYRVYLVGIIDDHSRFLVGWGLFRRQTADAVLEVVQGAIGQWGAPREILSDNGRQFVAWRGKTRFQQVLKQQGIQHVRSAPHHPMTLGKIERFWQTLWREFLSEAVFASFADACQRLDHWIQYYNHQRPHQGIDGACPADRFYGLAEDVEEALRQGCQENSLRLALGQEPQPPLYLLGQLGGTDVRVVRRGEEIEVKLGETVREVIRVGAPYEIGEDGHGRRAEAHEVAGSGRSRAVPDRRADALRGGGDPPAVPDVWSQPADTLPGGGGGGQCGGRSFDSQAAWPQTGAGDDEAAQGAQTAEEAARERVAPDEPALRGRPDAAGPAAAGAAEGVAGAREKNPAPPPTTGCAGRCWPERTARDGRP
jgi:transposase InsO family protein